MNLSILIILISKNLKVNIYQQGYKECQMENKQKQQQNK